MTEVQLKSLKDVYDTLPETLGAGEYIQENLNGEKCYCVIGYMMHKMGMSDKKIGEYGSIIIEATRTVKDLSEKYGLTKIQLQDLQNLNDVAADDDFKYRFMLSNNRDKVKEQLVKYLSV